MHYVWVWFTYFFAGKEVYLHIHENLLTGVGFKNSSNCREGCQQMPPEIGVSESAQES